METSALLALPEHLRPSWSAAGLRKGRLVKADRLGDRLYLTDIGEAVYSVLNSPSSMTLSAHQSSRDGMDKGSPLSKASAASGSSGPNETHPVYISLKWRKSYFPWKITMKRNGLKVVLEGQKYGASSWSGAISLLLEGEGVSIREFSVGFLSQLDHPPWESKYWDQEMWAELLKKSEITQGDIQKDWLALSEMRTG